MSRAEVIMSNSNIRKFLLLCFRNYYCATYDKCGVPNIIVALWSNYVVNADRDCMGINSLVVCCRNRKFP